MFLHISTLCFNEQIDEHNICHEFLQELYEHFYNKKPSIIYIYFACLLKLLQNYYSLILRFSLQLNKKAEGNEFCLGYV